MRILLVSIFCFCMVGVNQSLAQFSNPSGGTTTNNRQKEQQRDSISSIPDLAKDTFNFHFFYPNNIDKEFPYQDTTIERFQNYDPARQQTWDHGTIGNLGGAHFPFVYQPVQRGGFDIGFRQFELYKTQYDEFAFFRLRKAFTRLHFTQGKTQQDTYTQAKFSRNFTKGVNLTVDFKRMNHTGQYQNQKAENTSFNVGFWYKSPSKRYDAFISFISNTIFQQENGGINLAGLNQTNILEAFSVPVILNTDIANTAHTERAFHYHQRFLFNKQKGPKRSGPKVEPLLLPLDSNLLQFDSMLIVDSILVDSTNQIRLDSTYIKVQKADTIQNTKAQILAIPETDSLSLETVIKDSLDIPIVLTDSIPLDSLGFPITQDSLNSDTKEIIYEGAEVFKKRKRDYAFSHHGIFQVSKYKFSDTSPSADSSIYGNLQKDDRGLRYFIRERKVENIFTLNTTKVVKKGGANINKQKDYFEVGIRHSIHFLHQEPRDTIINNLFLQGRWNITPSDRLSIKTYADLGLIDNAGDYHMHADLFFDLKQAGQIKARAMHQSYSPTLMEYQHLLSQKVVWKNDFEKTFETNLSLSYSIPRLKLELIGQYHLLNQYIYYNSEGVSEQYNSPLSIGQLTVKKAFKFWHIHLDNQVTFQQISRNVIRLPEIYSWHSLYYEGRLFKKILNIQIGFDLRINTPYEAPGYQPATGQFYLANYSESDDDPYTYPDIDAFVNFKVASFRFFLKQENLLSYFTNDFHYQAKNYPLPYAYLRFGISWQFLD